MMYDEVVRWAGIIVMLIIAVGFFVLAVDKFLERQDWRRFQRSLSDRKLGAIEVGRELQRCAYWFSEDKKSMKLVQLIGQCIVEGKSFSHHIEEIRDEWRKNEEA